MEFEDQTMPLVIGATSGREFYIGKFPNLSISKTSDMSQWPQPVKMARDPEKKKKTSMPDPNFLAGKTKRVKRELMERYIIRKNEADPRKQERNWNLQDSKGGNQYTGTREENRASYVILAQDTDENFENEVLKIYPLMDWYNFKPKPTHALSLEEAEERNAKRNQEATKKLESISKEGYKPKTEATDSATTKASKGRRGKPTPEDPYDDSRDGVGIEDAEISESIYSVGIGGGGEKGESFEFEKTFSGDDTYLLSDEEEAGNLTESADEPELHEDEEDETGEAKPDAPKKDENEQKNATFNEDDNLDSLDTFPKKTIQTEKPAAPQTPPEEPAPEPVGTKPLPFRTHRPKGKDALREFIITELTIARKMKTKQLLGLLKNKFPKREINEVITSICSVETEKGEKVLVLKKTR